METLREEGRLEPKNPFFCKFSLSVTQVSQPVSQSLYLSQSISQSVGQSVAVSQSVSQILKKDSGTDLRDMETLSEGGYLRRKNQLKYRFTQDCHSSISD